MTMLEAGAEDAIEDGEETTVYTDQKDLMKVRSALIDAGLKVEDAELQYLPNTPVIVSDQETADKVMRVLDVLDDVDDVVNVHTNADIVV
ncbi:MAG: hypothetical protein QG649_672, partial [Patescibacteria group bacterium]|nr:hypothetical protein [Patescibacteria group bacterium]